MGEGVYPRLLTSTGAGTEAHSSVDITPGENGLGAWRRLVQRFVPVQAQADLNLVSRVLKPARGNNGNGPLPIEKRGEMARRQGERAGCWGLGDDVGRAIIMVMGPVGLERHRISISCRLDAHLQSERNDPS